MTQALDLLIETIQPEDKEWIRQFISRRWGADFVVTRGKVHHPADLPGYLAYDGTERIGLGTFQIQGDECEIVSLDSLHPGIGVGTALLTAITNAAIRGNCRRLCLVTTNDNLEALGFYQRRDFTLVAIHKNALTETRRLKPNIPMIGLNKIPLRDELELELILSS